MRKFILPFLFCIFLLCACGNTVKDPDIRNLKWGMSIDDVKKHENSNLINEETTEDSEEHINLTRLTYSDVDFMGYSSELELKVTDGVGLNEVFYTISTSDLDKAYQEICDNLTEEYGEPETNMDIMAIWSPENTKLTVILLKLDQISIDYIPTDYIPVDTNADDIEKEDYLSLTFDSVKLANKTPDSELEPLMLVYKNEKLYGFNTTLNYIFDDNGFFSAKMYYVDCNINTYNQVYEDIKQHLINEYGTDYDEQSGGSETKLEMIYWENTIPGITISLGLTYSNSEASINFIIARN